MLLVERDDGLRLEALNRTDEQMLEIVGMVACGPPGPEPSFTLRSADENYDGPGPDSTISPEVTEFLFKGMVKIISSNYPYFGVRPIDLEKKIRDLSKSSFFCMTSYDDSAEWGGRIF